MAPENESTCERTSWSFCDLSPELTRNFRGLRVWLSLMVHGTKAFKNTLQEKLQLARTFYEKVGQVEDVVRGPNPQLSIVIFRFVCHGQNRKTALENDVNSRVQSLIQKEGTVFITTTKISGILWLRLCICLQSISSSECSKVTRYLQK